MDLWFLTNSSIIFVRIKRIPNSVLFLKTSEIKFGIELKIGRAIWSFTERSHLRICSVDFTLFLYFRNDRRASKESWWINQALLDQSNFHPRNQQELPMILMQLINLLSRFCVNLNATLFYLNRRNRSFVFTQLRSFVMLSLSLSWH